jgi:response regulator RpfG family c-di-GMP phosphodiesterase
MLLTGCTALTKTEELVSAGVAEYCKAPELNRTLLRTRVSEALKPNSIKINCAN